MKGLGGSGHALAFPTAKRFNMDKNVSITKVDKRPYRAIAQENWGLTKEQMKGKHVHHRIRVSDGGTDDPSNLYVCSPLYHDVVWHGGTGGFIGLATEGAKKGGKKVHEEKDENGKSLWSLKMHEAKDENGKSLHSLKMNKKLHETKNENGKSLHSSGVNKKLHEAKDENGKSLVAVKAGKEGAKKIHEAKDENGKSLQGIENAKRLHKVKDENGKSLNAIKASTQVWESTVDGFRSNASGVARHNRANGRDPNARTLVG